MQVAEMFLGGYYATAIPAYQQFLCLFFHQPAPVKCGKVIYLIAERLLLLCNTMFLGIVRRKGTDRNSVR